MAIDRPPPPPPRARSIDQGGTAIQRKPNNQGLTGIRVTGGIKHSRLHLRGDSALMALERTYRENKLCAT